MVLVVCYQAWRIRRGEQHRGGGARPRCVAASHKKLEQPAIGPSFRSHGAIRQVIESIVVLYFTREVNTAVTTLAMDHYTL